MLGDAVEAGGLRAEAGDKGACDLVVILPNSAVFEDTGPRLADVDGDGRTEIVVVESDARLGAQLAVYGLRGGKLVKVAATPPIGRPYRWLAPAAIADLNGDGRTDIAYVETPHLGKTLKVWTWGRDGLIPLAEATGLTNHRIGDRRIFGGLRDCGQGPEVVTADAGWNQVMATRFEGGRLVSRSLGRLSGSESFDTALACR